MRARLATLKTRTDFLRVAAKGLRAAVPGLILQAAPGPAGAAAVRVGFTATRKLGGAVTRNRAKRRLRAVAAAVLTEHGRAGTDYVLIARAGTVSRPYPALVADLETALRRVSRGARAVRPAAIEKERG
jgi:ribonuclease P protein component